MTDEQLGPFKGQPWIVFDSVVSPSFLIGENRPPFFAIGTDGPAITRAGELIFFSAGRTRAQLPWYTNLDLSGQLSYGFRAWGVYVHFGFPILAERQSPRPDSGVEFQLNHATILASLLINFGVLRLNLGQEEQSDWPLHRFGSGGGVVTSGFGGGVALQNAIPQAANVQKLPEPIEIPRTQNLDAKIRLAPEVFTTIGTNAIPGVGCPLGPAPDFGYELDIVGVDGKGREVELPWAPYLIQVGLIGERIKKTQYGQVPTDGQGG